MGPQAVDGGRAVSEPPRGRFPVLPLSYVPRPQLWERLDAASQGAVTLLVAPAGAGKTLGVAGWLRTRERVESSLWLSAAADLDPATLDDLMRPASGVRHLLVVDDAHLLPRVTLDHIDDLLAEDPGRMSLMLLSRWDLSLTRLVPELLGHLTVLRGGVLRLDRPEVESLVAHHARTRDAKVVDAIMQLAQGWCAVAVLAAKSVGVDRDPRAAAARLLQGSTSATDRIMGEVYSALTPPQRHLLLCLVGESRVTAATARHLSLDDGAQRTLDDLVSTGLLVTRHEQVGTQSRSGPSGEVTFEVHPLLREIVQRRVRTGGVDVIRAKASVRSAVQIDMAQGDAAGAFRRLDAMGATGDVLDLLTEHGVDLAAAGQLDGLVAFARRNSQALEARPLTCLAVGLERWLAGDPGTARRWWERVLRAGEPQDSAFPDDDGRDVPLAKACAAVLLARASNAGIEAAVDLAAEELERPQTEAWGHSLTQLLRLESGFLLLRLDRVRAAERLLSSVVSSSATEDDPFSVAATAQLALAQFLEGRERACLELAETALRDTRRVAGPLMMLTRRTVNVTRGLAAIQRMVGPERLAFSEESFDELPRVRSIDPIVDTLERVLRARALLLRGAVSRAAQLLSLGVVLEDLPESVVRLVAFEQALMALLASDWDQMSTLAALLSARGCAAEAALVSALRADGMGDSRTADQLYSVAAVRAEATQPPTEAMALACRAQLLDAEGQPEAALTALAAAVAATRSRRNATPFLGWSRHGTPMVSLLRQLKERLDDDWLRRLVVDTATAPGGVFASAAITTPTPHERAQVPDGVPRPSLSLRERDVLLGLARGNTYADIAANLYVSENTVKTHVSSLYAKLAVGRRSDALAVARTLRLL